MNKHYLNMLLRSLLVVITIILGIFAIYFLSKLTAPFIIAFFIALLINPLVDFLQARTKMSRGFSVFTAIIIILAVISAAITLLVNNIITGFAHLSKIVPERFNQFTEYVEELYMTQIVPIYNNLIAIFHELDQSQRSTVLDSMQLIGAKLTAAFSTGAQATANGLYNIVLKLPNMATLLVISLLATFFMSKDWYKIVKKMHRVIPKTVHDRINRIYEGLQVALLGFLKAEVKLTFLTAVTVCIGLFIMRVDHALTIALIVWIIDFLPYLGAILVFFPWIIYNFFTGNVSLGIGLTILYVVIVVQRQLIKPKILSSSIGISPLLTLFTMFVGFKLIGVIGIILGPLTFIFLKILYETEVFKDLWDYIVGRKQIKLFNK